MHTGRSSGSSIWRRSRRAAVILAGKGLSPQEVISALPSERLRLRKRLVLFTAVAVLCPSVFILDVSVSGTMTTFDRILAEKNPQAQRDVEVHLVLRVLERGLDLEPQLVALLDGHLVGHEHEQGVALGDPPASDPARGPRRHDERVEVVAAADMVGSTEYIIRALESAEPGSAWAIGTELNLVRRLARSHPELQVHYLDSTVCFCSTMNRIDLPHLVWALESLVEGRVVNRISVDPDDAHWARVALDRMLALPGL